MFFKHHPHSFCWKSFKISPLLGLNSSAGWSKISNCIKSDIFLIPWQALGYWIVSNTSADHFTDTYDVKISSVNCPNMNLYSFMLNCDLFGEMLEIPVIRVYINYSAHLGKSIICTESKPAIIKKSYGMLATSTWIATAFLVQSLSDITSIGCDIFSGFYQQRHFQSRSDDKNWPCPA